MPSAPQRPPFVIQRIDGASGMPDLPLEKGRRPEDYEFRVVTVGRRASLGAVRAGLAAEAEYGRWELARTRIYLGGQKKVWLRRRIIRVSSTLPAAGM